MKELPGIPLCQHDPEFVLPGPSKDEYPICKECAVQMIKQLAKAFDLVITENNMDFMTPPEIAKTFKVSRQTVYNMIEAGKLPAIRREKHFYVPRSRVEQIMQTGLEE